MKKVILLNNTVCDKNDCVIIKKTTGGGSTPPMPAPASEMPDVRFLDYDGTLLYAYSKDEFLALSAMPALPTQEGLVCQGWNWSFADAQAFVTTYGAIDVGATYITDDGKTRIYVTIPVDNLTIALNYSQTTSRDVVVDWGDGNTSNPTGNSITTTHTYAAAGSYKITLYSSNNTYHFQSRVIGNFNYIIDKVEMGDKIDMVGSQNFRYAFNLTTITIPEGVTFSNANLFEFCFNLKSIVIPHSNNYRLFGYSFKECYSLSNISLPNCITRILAYNFQKCYSLKRVIYPDSVDHIDSYAHADSNIDFILLPNSVVTMGSSALATSAIKKVRLSPNAELSASLFYESRLKRVNIPNGVTTIATQAFRYCTDLRYIYVPESVTEISSAAFERCDSLQDITLPEGLQSIGADAFKNCYSLKNITIPSSLTSLGAYAFYYCFNLQTVRIENGLTIIPQLSFYMCMSLTSVSIPGSVTEIQNAAFSSCTSLRYMDFTRSTSVPTLANTTTINDNTDLKIIVPDTLYDEWIAATNWSSFASKIVKASEFTN